MTENEKCVSNLIRAAFAGVRLGEGVGLWQAQGLDDYADSRTLATYRARDEKQDWSAISTADLDRCYSSLSFFDAEGMRFHLPAYLIAELEGTLRTACAMFHLTYLNDYGASRFELLSKAQRGAVREFLLLCLADPHREFEHQMVEDALRGYWAAQNDP